MEISHRHDSRASAENLELIILTQDYLQLESVTTENFPDDAYEVTNTTGPVVIKVSTCMQLTFCAEWSETTFQFSKSFRAVTRERKLFVYI